MTSTLRHRRLRGVSSCVMVLFFFPIHIIKLPLKQSRVIPHLLLILVLQAQKAKSMFSCLGRPIPSLIDFSLFFLWIKFKIVKLTMVCLTVLCHETINLLNLHARLAIIILLHKRLKQGNRFSC